jgi:hypothetical protein
VPKLNFHTRFLEVHIILNQSQDAMWHFLDEIYLIYVEYDLHVGYKGIFVSREFLFQGNFLDNVKTKLKGKQR